MALKLKKNRFLMSSSLTSSDIMYCKTLDICGIKFLRFDENDILAHFNFDMPLLQLVFKRKFDVNLQHFFLSFSIKLYFVSSIRIASLRRT